MCSLQGQVQGPCQSLCYCIQLKMLSLSPTAPVINIRATTIVYLEGAFFFPTILIIKKKKCTSNWKEKHMGGHRSGKQLFLSWIQSSLTLARTQPVNITVGMLTWSTSFPPSAPFTVFKRLTCMNFINRISFLLAFHYFWPMESPEE